MTKNAHAIVIGAGFGGMAAAIRLRARGYAVTLLEARDQLGGRAGVFHKEGFVFDAGPTVMTAPYLIDELFAEVGRDSKDYLTLLPVDPFYRVAFHDGSHFDYVGDEAQLVDNIRDFAPGDVAGYMALADHSRRIFEIGYEQLAHVPFNRLSDMLRVVPDMLKLENYRSVYGLVSKYIKDERLRQVFSFQPLLVGGNPFNTSSIYLLIHWLERKWGVHFVKGGTTALVGAMGRLMDEIGVEVELGAPVESVDVDHAGRVRGVRVEDGRYYASDVVVANADPSIVYKHMIDKKHRRTHTDAAIDRKRLSMSLFVTYFGTSRTYPELAHHTIVLGPRYKGLLTDIFEKRALADDFSLYLHAPTRSDPSVAPAGCENFYVLSPVPNLRGRVNWESERRRYEERILNALERRLIPGLQANLITSHSVDPRYFEGPLRSAAGAAFGIEPRLTQSAYFRFHNHSEDVDGLYFVGSGTHPGAGVPGVLSSAKVLEHVIPEVPRRQQVPIPAAPSSPSLRREGAA